MSDLLDLFADNDNDWDNDWDNDICDRWNAPDWCDDWDNDPCDGWNTPDWCDTQDQIDSALHLAALVTQPIEKSWPWILGALGILVLMAIGMC